MCIRDSSKAALNNFAESIYFDFKKYNIRVSVISPGFIKTPEYAADQIYNGLIYKNIFEIHFPKALTIILKLLSFLPSKVYFGLIGRMTNYQKK